MTREEKDELLDIYNRLGGIASSLEQEPCEDLDFVQPHKKMSVDLEPCDDVCEWFEQYVDIATDIVELRFSDGTVKRAKRGLYMRDIEKSIRKMLIDQMESDVLNKIRAEICKSKTEHEMQIAERDIKSKLLISDIYCDIVNILDKYKAETE